MNTSESFLGHLSTTDRRRALQLLGAIALASLAPSLAFGDEATKAGAWPKDAFDAKHEADVFKLLYGKTAEVSDKITLDVPEIAENGAVVPVGIDTTLSKVKSISIIVPENPNPLIASYPIAEGTMLSVSSRIKMAKTSPVIAVIESDGKILMAAKTVKVTLGGCGG
jgi:sulfur-oxidizing protein SoxY